MAKKKSSMREKAKQKAEKNMNRGGNSLLALPEGANIIKPKNKGPYNWDVIPYKITVDTHPEASKGDLWYQRTYFAHFNVGPDNNAVLCPKTIKQKCPVCEHVKELFNSGEDDDVALAKDMKAKERELYNVIDLDDQDKGVQLLDISYHLFGKALDEEIHEGEDELADFAELSGGKTLSVAFRKKKLSGNEFFETRKIEFEDRDDYDEDILDDVFDLDSLLNIKSYEEIEKLLYGVDETDGDEEEKEEEEEEEDKKSKKSAGGKKKDSSANKKKSAGKKKKQQDEDENDDEDEKSKKKKSSGKKKSTSKKKNECPHGGEFGVDTDELDECENCDLWTECQEKWEELNEGE